MTPTLIAALVAGALAAPGPPINQHLFGTRPGPNLRFVDAEMGMTLAQWKALPPLSGLASQSEAECGAGPSGGVVCDNTTHYGKVSLAQSARINRNYLAEDPRYTFVNGRLVEIEFHASIDAFNAIMSAIESPYGPATETDRDVGPTYDGVRLPRVRKIWRLAPGSIEVIDPSSRPDELAVRLSSRTVGEARPARPAPPALSAKPSTGPHGPHA